MPKIVDHNQYRKALLGQCLDLFAEQGYGAITMRQIAQGLGVSTGTLYHYFPSKESIFVQLVEELAQHDIANFFAQAPHSDRLEERLDAVLNFCRTHQDYFIKQELLWIEFYQHAKRTQVEKPEILHHVCEAVTAQLMDYLGVTNPAAVQFLFVFLDGLWVQKIYELDGHSFHNIDQQLALLRTCLLTLLAQDHLQSHPTR